MKVLVIPEDFRNDYFILQPVFQNLFAKLGKPRAKIIICRDPLLGGVGEALKKSNVRQVVRQYSWTIDVFVLCVDRDGISGRRARLDEIEGEFGADRVFFAENAWEEIETWALAGLDLPSDWAWADVRAAVHVKERYFEPLARQRGVADGPGRGRKALGEEAARRIDAIRRKCPEDFDALAKRLETLS